MFFEKLNNYDIIKKLTYYISNIKTEISNNMKHKEDYEYIKTTYEDIQKIRHELQINNEKLYNFYFLITIYDTNREILFSKIDYIKKILYGLGFISVIPTYRLIALYKTTMPFNYLDKAIKFDSRKSMLTNTIASMYPFNSDKMYDEDGVLIGYDINNKSIKVLDRFDRKKYINGNLCVFGTSGSGKSYFIKTQILRNYIIGNIQILIDPQGEYTDIGKNIDAIIIKINENIKINIFDIDYIGNNDSFLENKIQELLIFFEIIINDLSIEEKSYLEKVLIKIYNNKGITFDNKSLYIYEKNKKVLFKPLKKEKEDFPILEDVYNLILKENKYNDLLYKIKNIVFGSLKWLNNYTNFDENNKTLIFDISNIRSEYIDIYMFVFLNKINKIIKNNKEKKIIYIDELWNLIGQCNNNVTPNFVVETFKTIRKYNGVATSITQDIQDLIVNQNVYGKTIINNSMFFCIFKQDIENIQNIKTIIELTEFEQALIKKLKQGECLFKIYGNSFLLKITSSNYEKGIIEMGNEC